MEKAKITISRPICNYGEKYINITVNDVDAGIEFLKLHVELEDFAECITGLSNVKCEMEYRGLQNVGKKIERQTLEFEIPKVSYNERKNVAYEAAKKIAPDGWSVSDYFGSQNSFFYKDGKDFARTSITRWVAK